MSEPADLLLINGKVFTGDDDLPWAEGVAIRGEPCGSPTATPAKPAASTSPPRRSPPSFGKGTITPGKLADLAVLSQDVFSVPLDALPATTSVLTIIGGRIVHEEAAPAEAEP